MHNDKDNLTTQTSEKQAGIVSPLLSAVNEVTAVCSVVFLVWVLLKDLYIYQRFYKPNYPLFAHIPSNITLH